MDTTYNHTQLPVYSLSKQNTAAQLMNSDTSNKAIRVNHFNIYWHYIMEKVMKMIKNEYCPYRNSASIPNGLKKKKTKMSQFL